MEKVQAGQELAIKASTWNAFIDAADYVKNVQNGSKAKSSRGLPHDGVILVKNIDSVNFEQFAALALTDLQITPAQAGDPVFKSTVPTFSGSRMTAALSEDKAYAILLEPVAANAVGRALLLGVVPAKVTVTDASHLFAKPTDGSATGALESSDSGVARILWKAGNSGSQWCMLQLGGAGSGGGVYNGLFKLADSSEVNKDTGEVTAFKFKVLDGNNPKYTGTMPCYVNGQAFNIPVFESDVSSSSTPQYVYIKFTIPHEKNGNAAAVAAKCEIVLEKEAQSQDEDYAFYQIGRIAFVNRKMKLYQDHLAGNVYMTIYGSGC